MNDLSNYIPEVPAFAHWTQPKPSEILVDDDYALMSKKSFGLLYEYSTSKPTNRANGKMWKSLICNEWFLRWVTIYPAGNGIIKSRRILII